MNNSFILFVNEWSRKFILIINITIIIFFNFDNIYVYDALLKYTSKKDSLEIFKLFGIHHKRIIDKKGKQKFPLILQNS